MADPSNRLLAVAAPATLTDTASDTLRGIGFVVLAYFLLTVGDVATKLVLPEAGVAVAMIGRGVFGTLGITGLALAQNVPQPWRLLVPKRWGMVLLRAGLSSFVSLTWYIAWRSMSLADTYAIGFTAPLLMTLMAVPLLGERIRWRRLMSTLVGFSGVLIMLRPAGDMWQPVVPLLLVGIVVMALTRIMTRLLATTETPPCLAVWLLISHTLAGCLMLPFYPPAAGAGGVHLVGAAAGRPGQRARPLGVRARLRSGADLGAGAVRIHHAAVRRPVRPAGVRRGPQCLDPGRGRRAGRRRALQLAPRAPSPRA